MINIKSDPTMEMMPLNLQTIGSYDFLNTPRTPTARSRKGQSINETPLKSYWSRESMIPNINEEKESWKQCTRDTYIDGSKKPFLGLKSREKEKELHGDFSFTRSSGEYKDHY